MKSLTEVDTRRSPNATQHLVGFLGFVLTGQTQTGGNIFDLIDQAPGDVTMAEMLIVASQQFVGYLIQNEYEPSEYEGIICSNLWYFFNFKISY